ncbi:MAG: TonB-dependent receptor [Steroidobacteraceae bacterium]
MFARGPHDGPATFETGDPRLKLERANSLEATVRLKLARSRFEGALWAAKFDRYIFGDATGRSCDEEGNCIANDTQDLKELVYRQGSALFRGAEAKAVIDVYESGAGTLQATGLADYVRATLTDNGNVPRISPYHIGAGLTWARSEVDVGIMVKYTGRQGDVGARETPTAGSVSVDAQTAWRPFAARPGIEFALVARNLADSVQRNAVALNKDEVLQPGREVKLLARARF